MLFDYNQGLEKQPKRVKNLVVSVGIHLLFVALVVLDPNLFQIRPKRVIRIAGQDYDLSKLEAQELTLQPPPSQAQTPKAPETKPLVQPPPEALPQPQAAPPPPPPPPPAPPPPTISPDDVIADGARPDGQPKASQGNTRDQARAGGTPEAPATPPPEPKGDEGKDQIAKNTNPNSLRLPNLATRAGRIVDETLEQTRRGPVGPRTGLDRDGPEDPNFSTEDPTILSDTRGYDFGPYMNQVVNRVRINWYSLIPEIARLGKRGRVVIIFTITDAGAVTDIRMVANSGTDPLDRAAMGAITASNPFQRLPANFDGDHLVLQFTFLYNIR